MTTTPDDHSYIIRGYDRATYNQLYIKDRDVVRPSNEMFTTERDKKDNWLFKSLARCPTYGTCYQCYACGPVGESCIWGNDGACTGIYTVIYYATRLLDSITLSNKMCTQFSMAHGDRLFNDNTIFPAMTVDMYWVENGVQRDPTITDDKRRLIRENVIRMLPRGSDNEKYILLDYDPGTYGQEYLKDNDLVRPRNEQCVTEEDVRDNWLRKSLTNCPSYGTCVKCGAAGPVGEQCISCTYNRAGIYTVLYYQTRVLDSLTLAIRLRKPSCLVRADRTFYTGTHMPSMRVNIDWLVQKINLDKSNTQEQRDKVYSNVMDMLPK